MKNGVKECRSATREQDAVLEGGEWREKEEERYGGKSKSRNCREDGHSIFSCCEVLMKEERLKY